MNRYNIIDDKNPREIILLRSHRCLWGRCLFCDYIDDNLDSEEEIIKENKEILDKVTGIHESLEVINSASVFELPKETLQNIKDRVRESNIKKISFEAYYSYKNRISEIRDFFKGIDITFKCGIETFNEEIRNGYLNKNIHFKDPKEVSEVFDTICLLVGFKGQSKEDVDRDIKILLKYFKKGCINIFKENSTPVKEDKEIVEHFKNKWSHLENNENIDILWNNTDYGVGD